MEDTEYFQTLTTDEGQFTTQLGGDPGVETSFGWVVFQITFYVCVIIFGVAGNGLVLAVYSGLSPCRLKQSSTTVLLAALAASDLVVCLFRFRNISILYAHVKQQAVPDSILYLEVPDKVFIANTMALTGAVAFDRYDCVCRPHAPLLSRAGALLVTVGCFVVSVMISLPVLVQVVSPQLQPPLITNLVLSFQTVLFLVTLLVVTVCYTLVLYRIRQHLRRVATDKPKKNPPRTAQHDSLQGTRLQDVTSNPFHASTNAGPGPVASTKGTGSQRGVIAPTADGHLHISGPSIAAASTGPEPTRGPLPQKANGSPGHHRRQNGNRLQVKTTRMLFLTTVVFVAAWLPYTLDAAIRMLTGNDSGGSPVSDDVLFNLRPLIFLNNAINPLVYGLANRRFRNNCVLVLKQCRR